MALEQPHVKLADLWRRGYMLLDVDEERVQAEWYLFERVDEASTESFFGAMAMCAGRPWAVARTEPSETPDQVPEAAPGVPSEPEG